MRKFLFIYLFTISLYADLKIIVPNELPQQYYENGKLVGIGIDILKEIQKRLNISVEIEVYPWSRAMAIGKKDQILYLLWLQ